MKRWLKRLLHRRPILIDDGTPGEMQLMRAYIGMSPEKRSRLLEYAKRLELRGIREDGWSWSKLSMRALWFKLPRHILKGVLP